MESNVGNRPNAGMLALTAGSASAVGEPQADARPIFQSTEEDRIIDDVTDVMAFCHVDINMRALALAEERGSWAAVARYLEGDLFKKVRVAASPAQVAELDACAVRLEAARLHEAVHGDGSLLDMDHWFNKKHLLPKPPMPVPTQTPAVNAILASLALFDASTGLIAQNSSMTPSGPATA